MTDITLMEIINKFKQAINKANNIIITTHLFPDADGIGSQISLCLALKKVGKNVICCNEVSIILAWGPSDALT